MTQPARARILGVPFDPLFFSEALDRACALARNRSRTSVAVAVNPEKVMIARENETIRRFIEESDLAIPDGIGVVFGARLLYGLKFERVPGADLMQALCRESGKRGLNLFIYGAKEEVNSGAVEKLRERYPDIRIVGRENGYVPAERFDELVERIASSDVDVLFLALGSPKQEEWVEKYRDRLNVGLCLGIGGTLDTIVGTVKRAPLAWQKAHLEWLYRLLCQPSRIFRQKRLVLFAFHILIAKLFGGGSKKDSKAAS